VPALNLFLDGDDCWPDLKPLMAEGRVVHLGNGAPPIGLAVLPGGMASGAPSVMLRIDLPDGRAVLAETSLALLVTAARAAVARYGDPTA
jgi:hypothetical protein